MLTEDALLTIFNKLCKHKTDYSVIFLTEELITLTYSDEILNLFYDRFLLSLLKATINIRKLK